MYNCEKHGELDSEWCDPCQKILKCDCSDMTYTRFKDMELDCTYCRTVTVRIYHCATCGEPSHAEV